MPKGEGQRWPLTLRRIHAAAAAGIIVTMVIGLAMTHMVADIGLRFELYQWHKSLGFAVLGIMLARWAARVTVNAPRGVGSCWQQRLAKVLHGFFYVALIALPVTGWCMVSASPVRVPTMLFGLLTMPDILGPDLALYSWFKALHGWLSWTVLLALALHVAGALVHRSDDIVSRMWRLRT